MQPEGALKVPIDCDLSEVALDDILWHYAMNNMEWVLTVSKHFSHADISALLRRSKLPLSVVRNDRYNYDEWSVDLSTNSPSMTIWSPGA